MKITSVTQFNINNNRNKSIKAYILPNFGSKGDTKKIGKIIQNSSSIVSGITAGFAMKNYFTYDNTDGINRTDEKLDEKQVTNLSSKENISGEFSSEATTGNSTKHSKLTHKELEEFILEQYNSNPPLWQASKKEAEAIRKTFIDNDMQEYLLNLYVRDNANGMPILTHNLENFDLSALPDIMASLNSKNVRPEAKYALADEILYFLYSFVADNAEKLENNKFSAELENYINTLKDTLDKKQYSGMHNVFYTQPIKNEFRMAYSDESIKSELVRKIFGPLLKTPKLNNYCDIDEITEFLDSPAVKSSYGSIINFNDDIVNSIANIVPTEENREKYNKMIDLLKQLPYIDYNKKDRFDISVIEKIMNAENYELLDVIKDRDIKYSPELEYVYKNINDKNFKNLVNYIHFDASELIKIIRSEDETKLPLLDKYLSSPLILNNKHIKEALIYAQERCSNVFAEYLADTYPHIFR